MLDIISYQEDVIKIAMRYYFIPTRMARIKKLIKIQVNNK